MDSFSLKPVKGLAVICKYHKIEFKGQRSNSLLNYHLEQSLQLSLTIGIDSKPLKTLGDCCRCQSLFNIGVCLVLQDVISRLQWIKEIQQYS